MLTIREGKPVRFNPAMPPDASGNDPSIRPSIRSVPSSMHGKNSRPKQNYQRRRTSNRRTETNTMLLERNPQFNTTPPFMFPCTFRPVGMRSEAHPDAEFLI
ncbi:hypothetical protein BS50DRAFT_253951 [Corynespora cassiicola Philippines]|uniref:Uncharacterized protein n=1 Tax=Corynespora cassiicola Philippines TaxID=1448308 RepID=A0A2T2P4D4_CORCC|nr:hypothetical protein BS50DRAFT_253951 [Corynespora cassiicola Philippines]